MCSTATVRRTASPDFSIDRGRSDNDVSKQFILSYVWELPKAENVARSAVRFSADGSRAAFSRCARGRRTRFWRVATTRWMESPAIAPRLSGTPKLSDDRSKQEKLLKWFNTAAFTPNPEGVKIGGLRNIMRGPGTANFDFGLSRAFAINEQHHIDFRFESFNLFNRANFNNPTNNLTSSSFGQVLSAKDPRILQLALKYSF